MKRTPALLVGLLLILTQTCSAETVTVGGAVVPVPAGWTRTVRDGTVVLSPPNLPRGVACTFTLLGGEPFTGSLNDRLTEEWKEFQALGRMVTDDGGKLTGAGGPVVTAGRSGQIEMKQGVNVYVWMLVISANGRIERMVYVTTTPEAFQQYGQAVSTMINGTRYVPPKPAAPPAPPAAPGQVRSSPGTFGRMRYTVPTGWRETRSDGEVVLTPTDLPAGESLEILLMPAKQSPGALAAELEAGWNEGARQSRFTTTRTVNNTAYNITQEQRTSFRGWDYTRADGVMSSPDDRHDYFVNLTVVRVNDRVERVLVRSRQNNQNWTRYSFYQSPDHNRAVQEFLFSLNFDDWKTPDRQPGTLKADGIGGVWWGVSMFGGKLHTAYAIFFSNGQAFFGSRFPLRGCYELNTWIDAEEVPRYWGTFQFDAGHGAIKMIYGEIPLEAKGDVLVLTTNKTEHRFVRVKGVDGARLDGNYVFPQPAGVVVPAIRFTADGRFDDRGALKLLRIEAGFPFSPTFEPGGGTYRVKDYTLLLNYADGRTYRVAFPGTGGYDVKNPSPGTLPLGYGDQELSRQ